MKLFIDNWRLASVPFYLPHGQNRHAEAGSPSGESHLSGKLRPPSSMPAGGSPTANPADPCRIPAR